jgi:hypothetical protein
MAGHDAEGGKIRGKVGVDDVCEALIEQVYNAIAEVDPWLGPECLRQHFGRHRRQQDRQLAKAVVEITTRGISSSSGQSTIRRSPR